MARARRFSILRGIIDPRIRFRLRSDGAGGFLPGVPSGCLGMRNPESLAPTPWAVGQEPGCTGRLVGIAITPPTKPTSSAAARSGRAQALSNQCENRDTFGTLFKALAVQK